jgi:hypothetical protein
VYKSTGWKGWGDWTGTGRIADKDKEYRSFQDARAFVHSLGLGNRNEWIAYCKSKRKPQDIPASPAKTYKSEWKGWGDWTGTGYTTDRQYRSFELAREFVHSLGLKSKTEWGKYRKSRKLPKDIPGEPRLVYKSTGWKGWGDWTGTGNIGPMDRKYQSFELAREFVHSLGLKSKTEWADYCKSGKLPKDIPTHPDRAYEEQGWNGWGNWVGTGRISDQYRHYRSFELAREFVHKLGLKSKEDWFDYCKSGKKPEDIPQKPARTYKNEWKWWADWLGYHGGWNIKKIKELLRDLIASKIIYQWNEAVLYSLLLRKGLLNLKGNRHQWFFKNLIEGSRTENGRKALEEYANSDSEIPPDLPYSSKVNEIEPEQEIQTATTQELNQLTDNRDPIDYGDIQSVEQILANTSVLESINVDEEAIEFYLSYSVNELWRCAFRDEEDTVDKIRIEGKNGNKYHDTVVETFLYDYEGTRSIEVPQGYGFPYSPTLMQSFVAYKVKSLPSFGNFSGTGAGKTLSAV